MRRSQRPIVADLEEQIGFQLRLAQLAVFNDIIARLKACKLRPIDLSALILIEAEPGLRQDVIGNRLKMARPNVVALIDSLEERGLVERMMDDKDRRANQVRLTPRGSGILTEGKHLQNEHRSRLLQALEGIDLANFMDGLTRLAELSPQVSD